MTFNDNLVLFALVLDKRADFFLDFLGELLKISPLREELGCLLDFFVFAYIVSLEEFKRLVELVEDERSRISLGGHSLHAVLDTDKFNDFS